MSDFQVSIDTMWEMLRDIGTSLSLLYHYEHSVNIGSLLLDSLWQTRWCAYPPASSLVQMGPRWRSLLAACLRRSLLKESTESHRCVCACASFFFNLSHQVIHSPKKLQLEIN